MVKLIRICFVLISLTATSALANDYQNLRGLFQIMPWTDPAKANSQIVEIRTRSIHQVKIKKLTRTMLSFLRQFHNEPAEVRTFHREFDEATFRSLTSSLTVWSDGILFFGKILNRNGKFEIVFASRYRAKRLSLKGPIVESESMQDLINQDVALEGYLLEDGRSIHVSKIKYDDGPNEIVFATGMLDSDIAGASKQREYYIAGPHRRRIWIKKNISSQMDQLIGTHVLIRGKYNSSSQLEPDFIHEELSDQDSKCATELLEKIVAKQKQFQSGRKK